MTSPHEVYRKPFDSKAYAELLIGIHLRTYRRFLEEFEGQAVDISVVDVSAPGDLAVAIQDKLFSGLEKRFICTPVHSPIERSDLEPSNPVILTDQCPLEYRMLRDHVQYLRREGYSRLWFLPANGDSNHLAVYGFLELLPTDFVTHIPRLGRELDLPRRDRDDPIRSEIGELGACLYPTMIRRVPNLGRTSVEVSPLG